MATRRMNLQSVLFLNHEKQELLFKYDDERYLYQSTKSGQKLILKLKIAKFCYFRLVAYLLLL